VINIAQGDLLKQNDVDAIVNTVNCVGVMGKGIALQFKNKWPANFSAYAKACKSKQVRPGTVFIFDTGGLVKPNFIINFPTKDHWRGASKIEYIEQGLADLVVQIRRLGIRSLAMPPLGCGNGGLDWAEVRPLIEAAFKEHENLEVRLFEPIGTPNPKTMDVRTQRPEMTAGRAAIIKLLDTYKELNYGLSKIEVQKLAYFLQIAGQPLKLRFTQGEYGPYADALRHALNKMEGHFIRGLGDGVVAAEIEPAPGALTEAESFIRSKDGAELSTRVDRVGELIDGFQSAYGLELLATVHWVANTDRSITNSTSALEAVHAWSDRKKALMEQAHVDAAWQRLCSQEWLSPTSR
jgi:O-acetyl-ADP-ribose deacetylase (regulator of RNase III)